MIEVMKKVQNLFEELVAYKKTLDGISMAQAATQTAQDETAQKQALLHDDLLAREGEVAKIESVVKLRAEAKGDVAALEIEKAKFREEKLATDKEFSRNRNELENRNNTAVSNLKALADREKALAEGQEKLEEDRNKMRADIIEELKKKV